MKKLYEKKEILFAVLWIVVYCVATIPIRGNLGDESVWMVVALAAVAAGATWFVKRNGLEAKYGLDRWARDMKRCWWFIPMWVLTTGNLWGGVQVRYAGLAQVFAVVSMLLVGYVEELLFRGFLFRALLKKDGARVAVIISAVTFGIGHIVNLLAGQASLETLLQVCFAVGWGFIFTFAFMKGGSLWPCVIVHGLVDVASMFSVDSMAADTVYMVATIVVAAIYCAYLSQQETALAEA